MLQVGASSLGRQLSYLEPRSPQSSGPPHHPELQHQLGKGSLIRTVSPSAPFTCCNMQTVPRWRDAPTRAPIPLPQTRAATARGGPTTCRTGSHRHSSRYLSAIPAASLAPRPSEKAGYLRRAACPSPEDSIPSDPSLRTSPDAAEGRSTERSPAPSLWAS